MSLESRTPGQEPIGLSAMHHQHLALGAVMVESDGWLRPSRYATVEQELEQIGRSVGLCDISATGKLSLQGSELDSALGGVFTDLRPLGVAVARRQRVTGVDNSESVVLMRLAYDEMMVLTSPSLAPSVVKTLEEQASQCSHVVNLTSALAGVRITGPSGHLLLAALTEIDVAPEVFPNSSCAQARVADTHGTLLRLDLGALLSYEFYFGREFGEYMWEALLDAGHEYEVAPFGLEAMERLNAGEAGE